ncbi:hypothetical protein [Azospirillum oleiclasticum]|uniref:hypothetical protein n=1 Tax=Azospirillum oleiclasticum TaxID=2735135 RepID=UPI0015D4F2A0|nr:hypothetical protein [Azospirillum oleiclasticum]
MTTTTLLLIAIAVIMMVAVPMVVMMKDFLPPMIERSANIDKLENRIYVLHSEAHDLQDRVNRLIANRNRQSSDLHRVESDIRKMEKAMNELADQPPLYVHEVGDPQAGLQKFTVNLVLERASAKARTSGDRVPVNPIWRQTNVAEVWAHNFEEAKQLVETAFPFKLGYTKNFVVKASESERVAERARKAVAEAATAGEPAEP